MNLIAKVLAEHQDSRVSLEEEVMPSYLVRCYGNGEVAGCSWEKFAYTFDEALDEWRSHVANEITEALGLTPEYAVCFEDDEQVWLIGDRRYLKPEFAREELPSHIQMVKPFVGRSYGTRWERHDG